MNHRKYCTGAVLKSATSPCNHFKPNKHRYFHPTALVLGLLITLLSACNSENTTTTTIPTPEDTTPYFKIESLPVDAAVVAGITPDAYRPHHGTFSIAVGKVPVGTYKIAARSSDQPTPTAAELTSKSAVYERDLSTTAINMLVSVHLDGTLFDTGATQDFATAKATLLQPETSYTLYAVKSDGTGEVYTLLTFSTTALSTDTGANYIYGLPSNKYVYTVKAGDPWVLYHIFRNSQTQDIVLNETIITSVGVINDNSMFPTPANHSIWSSVTSADKYILIRQSAVYAKQNAYRDTDSYAITGAPLVTREARFQFQ